MKRFPSITILALLPLALLFASCATTGPVTRVDANTRTDLSGNWNDTDVRIIANSLVTECVNARAISEYIRVNGRNPVVIVGAFRNRSDEHIDTSILTAKFEKELLNSGRTEFVEGGATRKEIRNERQDQQSHAGEDTAKALANETAADFMLQGSVKTMVDAVDGTMARNYIVSAQLVDIETTKIVWAGENSEIKKVIQRAKVKF
jgi:uncharacterized protein (TIGR02722 family)